MIASPTHSPLIPSTIPFAAIQDARVIAKPLGKGFANFRSKHSPARRRLRRSCATPMLPAAPTSPPRRGPVAAGEASGRRLLIIDEAYVDFAETNALDLVREHGNVIVLRSLSKSFSLAGMRLGLSFAQRPLTDALPKVKDSYNLNRIPIAVGTRAKPDKPPDSQRCRTAKARTRVEGNAPAAPNRL